MGHRNTSRPMAHQTNHFVSWVAIASWKRRRYVRFRTTPRFISGTGNRHVLIHVLWSLATALLLGEQLGTLKLHSTLELDRVSLATCLSKTWVCEEGPQLREALSAILHLSLIRLTQHPPHMAADGLEVWFIVANGMVGLLGQLGQRRQTWCNTQCGHWLQAWVEIVVGDKVNDTCVNGVWMPTSQHNTQLSHLP